MCSMRLTAACCWSERGKKGPLYDRLSLRNFHSFLFLLFISASSKCFQASVSFYGCNKCEVLLSAVFESNHYS